MTGANEKNTPSKRMKGNTGEELVTSHLERCGYLIIARNYYSKFGEIDCVCLKDGVIVFVEVKLREKTIQSSLNSITMSKKKRLIRTALCFLQQHREYNDYLCRFDVVAVQETGRADEYLIRHIEDAFSADEVDYSL